MASEDAIREFEAALSGSIAAEVRFVEKYFSAAADEIKEQAVEDARDDIEDEVRTVLRVEQGIDPREAEDIMTAIAQGRSLDAIRLVRELSESPDAHLDPSTILKLELTYHIPEGFSGQKGARP